MTVRGEDSVFLSKFSSTPYVEATEEDAEKTEDIPSFSNCEYDRSK